MEVLERPRRSVKVAKRLRPMSTSALLKRDLRLSVGEGSVYGLMVGVGETYLQAFVLAIGMGEVFAALIAALPQLVGSILQMISPMAIRKLGSHRMWVVGCAAIHTLCFVPLIIASLVGSISQAAVLVIASIYWGTSLGAGPAWNTWQGTVVPAHIRPKYFARRAKLSQIMTLFGFLAGGFALKAGQASGNDVPVFSILFAAAMVFRGISTVCLALQSEPIPIPPTMQFLSFAEQWQRFSRGKSGRLLVFAVGMQVGVFIAGPFFVPYMLKELHFEYHHFAILIGTSFLAKFLTLPMWGRVAHYTGAHRLLWIGGIGLIPLAGSWVFSTNYTYLLLVQFASGTFWAAYELALVLLFIEAIPESERTSLLTLYNFANSLALAVGSVIGATILNGLGVCASSYLWVFGTSTAVRLLTLFLLRRVPKMTSESEIAVATATEVKATPRISGLPKPV